MKSGQARVFDEVMFERAIAAAGTHRHPEKNIAILMVSFKLGLRAQEMALLEIKDVARLERHSVNNARAFTLKEIMALPASYTKGANACREGVINNSANRVLSFSSAEFDKVVESIVKITRLGGDVNPEDYYPPPRKKGGKSRDLPMNNLALRDSLANYLTVRLSKDPEALPSAPLFLSQKGGPYSANTLQDHIGSMLKEWAGIEKASSHSGRRTLLTNVHRKTKNLKITQKIAGHISAATTVIYTEATEQEIAQAFDDVS